MRHDLTEQARFVHLHDLCVAFKFCGQREELFRPHSRRRKAIPADDPAVAALLMVDFPQQTDLGLQLKPLQPVCSEFFRIAGEKADSPGPGYANALLDEIPLIHVECRDAVLDADDHVEDPVAKGELNGVHL